MVELQRAIGNGAVVQLVGADTAGAAPPTRGAVPQVDVRARVDTLMLAIRLVLKDGMIPKYAIDMNKAAEALAGLTPTDGRAISQEYLGRTGLNLKWLISEETPIGNDIKAVEQQRLLNLLDGTVPDPAPDPAAALDFGIAVGGVVGGAARTLGFDVDPDKLGIELGAHAAKAAQQQQADAEALANGNLYRSEAADLKRALDKEDTEKACTMLRVPETHRSGIAQAFEVLYSQRLSQAIESTFSGKAQERVKAVFLGDLVTADRIALEAEVAALEAAEGAQEAIEEGDGDRRRSQVPGCEPDGRGGPLRALRQELEGADRGPRGGDRQPG